MSEPAWKSFVDNLQMCDDGSGYDERLPAGAAGDGLSSVQQEVIEEMSAGLRRSAQKIEKALVRLAEIDDAIRDAETVSERKELVDDFNAKRREALQARRDYLIQREAIGFFRNGVVEEEYPVPPKRYVVGPRGQDGRLDGSCD
jgi:hypothetical protein